MADLDGRYPIATADGIAIPNDTIRPRGLYRINVSTSALSASIPTSACAERSFASKENGRVTTPIVNAPIS